MINLFFDILTVPINRIKLMNLNIICDGNSLTYGYGVTTPYPEQLDALLTKYNPIITNIGVNAQTTPDMISDFSSGVQPRHNSRKSNILLAWEITNDIALNSADASTAYNNFKTYCELGLTGGFYVIAITALPRAVNSGGDTDIIQSANDLVRADNSMYNSLIDVWNYNELTDVENTTYYQGDKVHLTNAGYSILSEALYEKIYKIGS